MTIAAGGFTDKAWRMNLIIPLLCLPNGGFSPKM
jgi:hypothetical protein